MPATPESLFFGVATAKSLGVDIFHVPVPRPVPSSQRCFCRFINIMCRDGKEGVGARLVRKRHWQLSLTSCLFCAAMFIVAGVKGRGRARFNT